jgi:hypothetical protein
LTISASRDDAKRTLRGAGDNEVKSNDISKIAANIALGFALDPDA